MQSGWTAFLVTTFILIIMIVASSISSFFSYKYARIWLEFPVERWEYEDWAVVSDAKECAQAAKKIFQSGGWIGDAAVAALACMAVVLPHRSGLGGGLMAVYYNHSSREVEVLNSLGASPLNTTESMFAKNETLASYGRMAPIVPGAVAGYAALHRRLGRMEWKRVLEPALNYAKKGFAVSARFVAALLRNEQRLLSEPKLQCVAMLPERGYAHLLRFAKRSWLTQLFSCVGHLFWNYGLKRWLLPNEALQQPLLAEVLEEMSKNDRLYFYRSRVSYEMEMDLQRDGGIMTQEDIAHYRAQWIPALQHKIGNRIFYTAPSPGAGALLGALATAYQIKDPVLTAKTKIQVPEFSAADLHRLVELLKFTIARMSALGESTQGRKNEEYAIPDILGAFQSGFNEKGPLKGYAAYKATAAFSEDYGGGYLALRDKLGNALSIVTSLNSEFGCLYVTSSGIIMNNFMDLFSRPGGRWGLQESKNNQLQRVKRPQTSIMPVIITEGGENGELFAALGTTGGLESISAMGQLLSCLTEFPLFSCVRNNVRLRVVPGKDGFSVMTGPASGQYDPGKLLQGFGHNIVKGLLTSTVSGIMSSGRRTWLGVADTTTTDGGSAGSYYVHPILRNQRGDTS